MPIEEKLLKLTWTLAAWDDYEYWQGQDKKTLKRINALIIVNGATAYASFVNELNARIDAYNQMLALRKGKKDAKDDKKVDK